jgi:hypothetical protein
LSSKAIQTNGKLFIEDLRDEDDGYYECFNSNGQSYKVKLTVINRNKNNRQIRQHEEIKTIYGPYDGTAELTCQYTLGNEDQIYWRKIDQVLLNNNRSVESHFIEILQ